MVNIVAKTVQPFSSVTKGHTRLSIEKQRLPATALSTTVCDRAKAVLMAAPKPTVAITG